MSSQGHGYVWEVICDLCGAALDQTLDQLARLVVNLPTLQDVPTLLVQTVHSLLWTVCIPRFA